MQPSSLLLSPNIFLFQRIETQWQCYALYKNCCYYYYYYASEDELKGKFSSGTEGALVSKFYYDFE